MAEGPKKAMVVEDDRFLSSLLRARLEKDGLTVVQAFDGAEAMKIMKDEMPDVILLDLIMPKATGFDVLQAVSMTPGLEKVPVVILSNLAQDSDIEKARELGAREYFVKVKVSVDDIVQKVNELLQP